MFDTSIVRMGAVAAPRRMTLLTASLAIHSAAVIAAVSLSLASTTLPNDAPRQLEMFRTAELPATPPPPLGRPAARREAQTTAKPQVVMPKPNEFTAPRDVPVETPQLESPAGTTESGATDTAEGDGPIGDPSGVDGGVGVTPGGGTGTPTYHPGGGVTSARVLTRVQPRFPQSMIQAIRVATVIVLCVVDKQGRIRDPKIVMSSYPPFNQAVLDALQQWTFEPGSYGGKPVDTYFELKVKFEVR